MGIHFLSFRCRRISILAYIPRPGTPGWPVIFLELEARSDPYLNMILSLYEKLNSGLQGPGVHFRDSGLQI